MSRVESAIRLVLEFHAAFNRHDVTAMMQWVSDDCIFEDAHPAPNGAVYSGKQVLTQFWQDVFHTSPDAHIEIEEIFGLGDRCVMRWRRTWTDEAGEKRQRRGVSLFKLKNGLICEHVSYVKG